MRGSKTSRIDEEKVIALYKAGERKCDIAREVNIGRSTVNSILDRYSSESSDEELEEIRKKSQKRFAEEAQDVAKGILGLLSRRVETLIEHEDALDEIINIIEDSDMTLKSKDKLIVKMRNLLSPRLSELTSSFGNIYDRLERMAGANNNNDGEGVGGITIAEVVPLEGESDE